MGVARARAAFVELHVRPRAGDRVLDVGCGPGSLVPYLPGVDYTGVDANPRYVAEARDRFPQARFFTDRIGEHVVRGEHFDLVIAAGVLHHLSDAEALELLHLAAARLRPGGRLITLDPCLIGNQNRVARWFALGDRGRCVRWKDAQLRLMRGVFPGAAATLHHDLLRVPYTHLAVECARD